ncbi:hypothetical protein MTO96_036892 [Rhipicephalus appendiculatus]
MAHTPLRQLQEDTPLGPLQGHTPLGPLQGHTPLGPLQEYTPLGPLQEYTPLGPLQEYTPPGPAAGVYAPGPAAGVYAHWPVARPYALVPVEYTVRQQSPAGTYLSGHQSSAAPFQSHTASLSDPVTSEAGGYVTAVTPQQHSSLNRTRQNYDSSRSTGLSQQSLPGEVARLSIDGPQETFQRAPPQRTPERGRDNRRGPFTQRPPMQHAVGGRQAQAPVTYAPPVQSQPSTSGLQRYGAPSSFHRGNSPTRGPYSGSHNRWASAGSSGTDSSSYTSRPPATSSGSASSSYSSTSGSSHRGSGRGSWNSNNESGVGERHRPGVNPGAASNTHLSRFTTPLPEVKANHFKLDLNRQLVVYHYEVTIWWGEEHLSPETEAKLRLASRDKRRILAEFSKAHKIATNIFDGQKCLYSTKKLELKEETKTVHVQREIGEKIDEFYVRIRQVQPTTPRSGPPAVRGRYKTQRANHSAKTDHHVQKRGEATYSGILTSVRSGQSDLFVNADTMLTSFYEAGPLLTYVEALLGRKLVNDLELEEPEIRYLDKKLRDLKVFVKHLKFSRARKIKEVTMRGAHKIKVDEALTVATYFEKTYRKLEHPRLPCVEVESKKGKCFYPLEMCFISLGQRDEQSESGKPVKPLERFNRAINVAQELEGRRKDILGDFFTGITTSPVNVNAKVLPSSKVFRKLEHNTSPKTVAWAIVNVNRDSYVIDSAHILKDNLVARGMRYGIELASNVLIDKYYSPDLEEMLKSVKQNCVQLVVIILKKNSEHYKTIKHYAETELGLITQCVAIPPGEI